MRRREFIGIAGHLDGRPVAPDFDYGELADALGCYSASDIRFLVDEAARDALKKSERITNESFRIAMTRIRPSVTPEIETQYQSIEQRGF
jgi:SpoVK/Ycf46/Vps4 family AAA+-type ATPase